jgi:hypothetical protein
MTAPGSSSVFAGFRFPRKVIAAMGRRRCPRRRAVAQAAAPASRRDRPVRLPHHPGGGHQRGPPRLRAAHHGHLTSERARVIEVAPFPRWLNATLPQQVHPVRTNRGIRPPRRQEVTEAGSDRLHHRPVSAGQPVRLVVLAWRSDPPVLSAADASSHRPSQRTVPQLRISGAPAGCWLGP